MLRCTNRVFTSDNSGLSYAVIKNLRRRDKNTIATAASDDVAEVVEATTSLSTKVADASAVSVDTPMSFENAVYSAGSMDDDFGVFLHDSSTSQTPHSSIGMESLTDANDSITGFSSDSHPATEAPVPTLRMQQCNNAITSSTDEHMPDGTDYGSSALDNFPQMELGARYNFGDEGHNELCWEPQNGIVRDGSMPSIMEGLSTDTSSLHSAHAAGEARKVSLFLEDMQPETANRVTTMLLNGNVDLKMKMTIR